MQAFPHNYAFIAFLYVFLHRFHSIVRVQIQHASRILPFQLQRKFDDLFCI